MEHPSAEGIALVRTVAPRVACFKISRRLRLLLRPPMKSSSRLPEKMISSVCWRYGQVSRTAGLAFRMGQTNGCANLPIVSSTIRHRQMGCNTQTSSDSEQPWSLRVHWTIPSSDTNIRQLAWLASERLIVVRGVVAVLAGPDDFCRCDFGGTVTGARFYLLCLSRIHGCSCGSCVRRDAGWADSASYVG